MFDEIETIDRNPKSWAAWKREAERLQKIIDEMTTNHPAHGPVSLDRLHQISEILSKAAAQSNGGNLGYAMADAVKVINGAIAAFGAEPVPCPKCNDTGMADSGGVQPWGEPILIECDCRADMLQAGNHTEQHLDMVDHSGDANKKGRDGTLIDEGTIPATRFQTVADLYGITSPTGSETSFTFDSFEASSFAKGGWSVQEYVELERYQEALVGNSPVTPDGYVLVPIEPTENMIINGFESEPDEFFSKSEEWDAYQEMSGCEQAAHRAKLCWAAMIKAAPQQEVTSARVHPARNK